MELVRRVGVVAGTDELYVGVPLSSEATLVLATIENAELDGVETRIGNDVVGT